MDARKFLYILFAILAVLAFAESGEPQDSEIFIRGVIPEVVWDCEFEFCQSRGDSLLVIWSKSENLPAAWKDHRKFFFPLREIKITVLEKIVPDLDGRYKVAIHNEKVNPENISPKIYFVFSQEKITQMENLIPVDRARISEK